LIHCDAVPQILDELDSFIDRKVCKIRIHDWIILPCQMRSKEHITGKNLTLVAHCERGSGDVIRIISARKATTSESSFYHGGTHETGI
jgi:hypothetical protein